MVDIGRALEFPTNGDGWLKTILIGGILSALGSFLFLPLIPVQGYFVQVLRAATTGSGDRPSFKNWGTLFVDGIKLFVVQIVYGLVPFLIFGVGITIAGIGIGAADGGSGPGLFGGVVVLVGALAFLVAIYLLPAGLSNMAHEGRLGAAFDVETLVAAGTSADYLIGVVIGILVAVVLGGLAGVLSLLLVGVFLAFYTQVVVYYVFGRAFANATGSDTEGATQTDPEPTETVGWE